MAEQKKSFTDAFELNGDNKVIVKIKDEDTAKSKLAHIQVNKDTGKLYYNGDEHDYDIADELQDTFKKMKDHEKENRSPEQNYDIETLKRHFDTIGRSFCFQIISKITNGDMKGGVAGKIDLKKYDNVLGEDIVVPRYNKEFEGYGLSDDFFKENADVFKLIERFAAKGAYWTVATEKNLADGVEYVVKKDDGTVSEYHYDTIKTDQKTKPIYENYKGQLIDALNNGIQEANKECRELNKGAGGTIKDPITGEEVKVAKDGLIKQALKGIGNATADVLGISNGQDIYSKMFRTLSGALADQGGLKGILNKLKGSKGKGEQKDLQAEIKPPQELVQRITQSSKMTILVNDHLDQNIEANFKRVTDSLNRTKVWRKKLLSNPKAKADNNHWRNLERALPSQEIIPMTWKNAFFYNVHSAFESYFAQDELLSLLNEADEEPTKESETLNGNTEEPEKTDTSQYEQHEKPEEKTDDKPDNKTALDKIVSRAKELASDADKTMKAQNVGEFKDLYGKWSNAVAEFFRDLENVKLSDKAKQELQVNNEKDPYEKICLAYKILYTALNEQMGFSWSFQRYIRERAKI